MLLLVASAGLGCLSLLSITDLREGRLPNAWVAALAVLGGAFFFLSDTGPGLTDVAIGLVVGPGFLLLIRVLFERLRGAPGLGLGDVKFAGAAALWVGASGLPLLFFVASTATLLGIGLLVMLGRLGPQDLGTRRIPFGPGLSLGLAATVALQTSNAALF